MKKGFSDDTFLARWLAGQLKDEEQKNFEERDDYADFDQIIKEVEHLNIPPYSEEKSWEKLLVKKQTSQQAKIKRLIRPAYAAAATILILIGVGLAILFGQQNFATASGQKLTIHLPDDSEVYLNANSAVHYNRFFWLFERKLKLEGEGFFVVEKGSTFTVHTPAGNVSVLGTSFNVWARNQRLEVVCHTGKVNVNNFQKSETIQAGEKVNAVLGNLERSTLSSLNEVPSWVEGISRFEEVPVRRILEELEYQFDVQIEYQGDLQKELTFSFPHNDLEAALRLLSGALEVDYEMENNKVILY